MRKSILTLTIVVLASAVNLQAQVVKSVFIKDQTSPCTGVAPMNCLNVRFESSTDWELFYGNIEGFDYIPGYQYELLVTETKIPREQIPADGSSTRYQLKKTVCKVATADAFWNTNWTLTELNGEAINSDAVKVEFNAANNSLYGKSGCNNFNMPITINKKRTQMHTKHGMGTKMACEPENMKLENSFLQTLANKKIDLQMIEGQLNLLHKKKVLMKFKKNEENKRTALAYITNKKFKLIQMNGKLIETNNPEITIDVEGKKISGKTSCNNFFGTVNIDSETVHFGAIGTTRMACMDEKLVRQEREYLALLNEENLTYDVADQTLNIYKEDKLVLMFGLYQ